MHVAGFTGASQCVACTRASLVGFQSAINFSSAAYEFTSDSFATTMSPRVLTIAFQELVRLSCRTYEKSAIFGSSTNVIAVELAGIEPVRRESYAMNCHNGDSCHQQLSPQIGFTLPASPQIGSTLPASP